MQRCWGRAEQRPDLRAEGSGEGRWGAYLQEGGDAMAMMETGVGDTGTEFSVSGPELLILGRATGLGGALTEVPREPSRSGRTSPPTTGTAPPPSPPLPLPSLALLQYFRRPGNCGGGSRDGELEWG